jgi:hypothetical protein
MRNFSRKALNMKSIEQTCLSCALWCIDFANAEQSEEIEKRLQKLSDEDLRVELIAKCQKASEMYKTFHTMLMNTPMESVFQVRRDIQDIKFSGKNLDEHFSKMLSLRSRLRQIKGMSTVLNFVLKFWNLSNNIVK